VVNRPHAMSQNPFYVGGPVAPDFFVGRVSEVNIAFDQILKRGHLAIWGGPGMGKSSLLDFLASPGSWQMRGLEPHRAIRVYLNCTDIHPFQPEGFWRSVLNNLREGVESDLELSGAISDRLAQPEVGKDDLRQILKLIGQRDQFLLLLLDDYDLALRTHEDYDAAKMLAFLSSFRNLAVHSREKRYFASVVVTFRRLSDLGPKLTADGSPWYNHYKFLPLKPFDENEVSALFSMPITPALHQGVREIADGHPALLQIAGDLLYHALRTGEMPDPIAFAQEFQSLTEQFSRSTWELTTPMEQMLMMLIALANLEGRLANKHQYDLGDLDLIFSQRSRELWDLEELGVITCDRHEGGETYRFNSSMMEWWVIKEIENSSETDLEQRKRLFLGLSSKQIEQISKVMHQVQQYQEAATSIAGWVGSLVKAFATGML